MPDLVNPLAAYRDAYSLLEGQAQDATRRQAGNALASGDYQGAQSALYGRGMIEDGLQVQQRQLGMEDRQAGQQQAQEEARKKQLAETFTLLGNVNEAMAQVPAEQRAEYFRTQVVPQLQSLPGVTPQAIAEMTAPTYDWSDQGVATHRALLGQEAEKYNIAGFGSGGIYRANPRTGQVDVVRNPDPVYQTVGPGQELYVAPRDGGVGAGSPPGGGAVGGVLSGGPRGVRNNNPGNIEDGPFARSLPGYKGTDGRFAVFETPQAGQSAQGALLQSYGRRGINTVQAIIGRWAPQSDGNPTNNYSAFVAKKLGVSQDQSLDMNNPQVIAALSGAIADFENGGQSASSGPPAPAMQGGPQLVARGAPKPEGHLASPQERASLGIAGEQPVWIGADGKPDVINTGGTGTAPRDRMQLRKEFDAQADVKAFNDVATSYDIISRVASAPPTAQNDLSLIFAYMKMLDPGSVVREGEFANAQNSAGVPEQVVNAYNKALNGQRLNANQRQQFVNTARSIYTSRKDRYSQLVSQYQGYAREAGLPETTIQPRMEAGPGPSRRPRVASEAAMRRQQALKAAGQLDLSKPRGSRANPYIAKDQATADRLPPGSYVIMPDGSLGIAE